MPKSFIVSIVCFFVFAASTAQTIVVPYASAETEIRTNLFQHFSQSFPFRTWDNSIANEEAWKQWALVENYSFGKDRGSLPMIADLQSLHPYFRDKVIELIRACRAKGIEVLVVETYRTRAKQNEYVSMGRRYTRATAGSSKHQYGLAIDIVPVKDSVIQWNNIALWRKVGATGERLGLRWGGRWRRPFDPAHFEWTGGMGTYHLAQGNFPLIPKAQHYPCIDEDLQELQRHWKAWETEQSLVARSSQSRQSLTGAGHD